MPTTTKPHRRQKPRAWHELISRRPLHHQRARHNLYAHMFPQLKPSTGKSRSPPNITGASCIEQSHVQVSALSRMRKQRIKELEKSSVWKLYYCDLSKENKGPLQMSDGSNLCLKEYCNVTINFSFHPNWGPVFHSERDSHGSVQSCSKMGPAWGRHL